MDPFEGTKSEGKVTAPIGQSWTTRTEFHLSTPDPIGMHSALVREVSEVYGGATLIRHIGGWMNPEGRMEIDHGVTIIAYGYQARSRELCQRLLAMTDQRAMVVAVISDKVYASEVFRV